MSGNIQHFCDPYGCEQHPRVGQPGESAVERAECLLHPDGSFTGTDAGRWQCDQCAANDQYRERFFDANAELARLRAALKQIAARKWCDSRDIAAVALQPSQGDT